MPETKDSEPKARDRITPKSKAVPNPKPKPLNPNYVVFFSSAPCQWFGCSDSSQSLPFGPTMSWQPQRTVVHGMAGVRVCISLTVGLGYSMVSYG